MTVDTVEPTFTELNLSDMVRLTILNEFGPKFAENQGFTLLESATQHRLNL